LTARRLSVDAQGGYSALGLELLLFALQSPINIGMILRVAETYQFRVSIFDAHGVLDDPKKLSTVEDFACGALSRRNVHRLDNPDAIAQLRAGRRLIATSIEERTASLPDLRFAAGDIFVLGNEYDGLPQAIITGADAVARVPMPAVWTPKPKAHEPIDPGRTAPVARDGRPNLNVAMTAGIICCAAFADRLARHASPESNRLPGTRASEADR
jgi:tRNA G18 (ribose-2'-O)-methylase SpoU